MYSPTHQKHDHHRASWWLDIMLIILVFAILYFSFLGSRPLFVPDEGRYAEIAREMVATNNYITPYLNGIKYFEKPILFYWLEAGMIKLAGLSIWSLRSINALLAILGVVATYSVFRILFERRTALISSFILGSSLLYITMAHMITLDLPVTCFISLSLYSYLLTTQQTDWQKRRYLLWLSAGFAALAVLIKGLIGIVFPILILLSWLLLRRDWRGLKELFSPSSMFVFLIIVAPWHILVGIYNHEFYYYYFIEQHFLRYATPEIGHYQPVWYFIPVLMVGFFPWLVFLPQAIYAGLQRSNMTIQDKKYELFFILWAAIIFVFFSFSKSKLIPYILPVIPPLAGLVGIFINQHYQHAKIKQLKVGFFIFLLISLLFASVLIHFSQQTLLPTIEAKYYLYAIAATLVLGFTISNLLLTRHLTASFISIVFTIMTMAILFFASFTAIDNRSIVTLANVIKSEIKADDDVITYNQYYQDLPFYLKRRVSILNWKNEFAFGMKYQNTQDWMIDDTLFWQRFHSKRRVFVIISDSEYKQFLLRYPHEKSCVLGKTSNTLAISNQGQASACLTT